MFTSVPTSEGKDIEVLDLNKEVAADGVDMAEIKEREEMEKREIQKEGLYTYYMEYFGRYVNGFLASSINESM